MSILDIRNVTHHFGGHTALSDITFSVTKGEILGIIGSSGAGKSTLLRCLCGLERPLQGQILLEGADLTDANERTLVALRRKIGLVFQHFNLLESRDVVGNIGLPLQIAGWKRAERTARIQELVALVGLSGHEHKRPSQLSGGQKQRVGIARALAVSPALLLCDEATSALDPHTTTAILELLVEINKNLGLTIILITHEMDVVRRFAQRVLVLDHGQLIEDGTMAELMRDSGRDHRLETLLADIRPHVPKTIANRLHAEPTPGSVPVLRLVLGPDQSDIPLLALLARGYHQDAILLQGGTITCGGELLSDMILQLSRPMTSDLIAFLDRMTHMTEVLGHVPSDR